MEGLDGLSSPQWITLVMTCITGLGVPVLLWIMTKAGSDRKEKFDDVHKRLDHIDNCVDDVRNIVVGSGVTRKDLDTHKVEILETLTRMRAAISAETVGLNSRIMRIEDIYLRRPDIHGRPDNAPG